MPKGKYVNHKGRVRKFTNPEELELERQKAEENKKWRDQNGEGTASSEAGDSSASEEETAKAKGVSNLIEIQNPNRLQRKTKKLTSSTDPDELMDKTQLSRRQREEVEKQRMQATYQKLHNEGKTEQARADLARLAIIKQQREEAQKRRELEKKLKEDAAKLKAAQTNKALGKK